MDKMNNTNYQNGNEPNMNNNQTNDYNSQNNNYNNDNNNYYSEPNNYNDGNINYNNDNNYNNYNNYSSNGYEQNNNEASNMPESNEAGAEQGYNFNYNETNGMNDNAQPAYQNTMVESNFGIQDVMYQNIPNPNANQYAEKKEAKKKKGGFKRALSYVLVGLVCATLGGAASTGAVLYLLPKSDAFKDTPLYKSVATNTYNSATAGASLVTASTQGLTVAQIAKKVGPAVVGVSTKSVVQSSNGYGWPFGSGGQQVEEGMGSGIIVSSDGYILTNNHVIDGAQTIKVILSTGKTVNAKLINTNANADVAVIQITDKVDMPAVAELGDSSSMQVGDPVVAIGNPLGQDLLGTVTSGIISALNRQITIENKTLTLIQTDAAINEGNSGGPLINALGQVVGMNTAKYSNSASSSNATVEGIGFAIPINTIKTMLPSLEKPGANTNTTASSGLMIGITGEELTEDEAKQNNAPAGVYVVGVTKFSAAAKAGIQPGDVITKFDGQKVATVADINTIKAKHKVGDKVKVEVFRDKATQTLELKFISQ